MQKERIAILTSFDGFRDGYSLTGIVLDQYRMFKEHGHQVRIYTSESFDKNTYPGSVDQSDIRHMLPFAHLIDYASIRQLTPDHKDTINKMIAMLKQEMQDIDIIISHDLTFQGWQMPYGLGLIEFAKQTPSIKVLHWIHSIPTVNRDWWDFNTWGSNNRLVYPNKTDQIQVAEQYRTGLHAVRCVHHIKDLRTFWDFDPEVCDFIKQYPAIMQSDIVQVYPASTDRLTAKRVAAIVQVFSEIKKRGKSVCLVVANQHANDRMRQEDIQKYKNFAQSLGLLPDEEFIFTSDFKRPTYELGIPKRMVRELMLCSNFFMFPTKDESFGLVLPESGLCGVLGLYNRSLELLREVSGGHGIYFPFGSFNQRAEHTPQQLTKYYKDLAHIAIGRILQNESIMLKTFCRKRYNYDYLYQAEYAPLIAESKTW